MLSKNKKEHLFKDNKYLYNEPEILSILKCEIHSMMVGEVSRRLRLEELLSEAQVQHIVAQASGAELCALQACDVTRATDGLAGFLGEHLRATLRTTAADIRLFIKCVPTDNQPKADFINTNNYFKRENFMFQLFHQIRDDNDPNPWCPKAYIYTDSVIVMPDLALEGYATKHYLSTLDYEHVMLGVATIARYHAAFTNYETRQSILKNRPYNTNQEYENLFTEPTFCDSPYIKSSAKLTANFLKAFSSKSYRNLPNLEEKLAKLYIVACDTVTDWKGTLNVLIHKDLWMNNIMFKYANSVLSNALLVDFQLVRYAPPVFDLLTFMYCTTTRSFREKYERAFFDHYFAVFCDNLDADSERRMEDLGYDKKNFLCWCEKARMFGVVQPAAMLPFVLMDPKTAQQTFDNPATFERHMNEDRSGPVLAYARRCSVYRERLLEVSEELVERYVLTEL